MTTRELKKRLHYLKGQIEGIERMLDDNRIAKTPIESKSSGMNFRS